MKILIIGAGTIGLSYGWILSTVHDVSFFVRKAKINEYVNGIEIKVNDRRKYCPNTLVSYIPKITTTLDGEYNIIIVTVTRNQLAGVLPLLKKGAGTADIIFMLNHWNIQNEVKQYLDTDNYFIGFPSQIGGGRDKNKLDIIVFDEGTILGNPGGKYINRILEYKKAFEAAGLSVEIKEDMLGWLKLHYLQQSISAGAILKAGNYHTFATSHKAVKEMVYAFREGIAVCEAYGVDTKNIFPASMFRYPAPLVATAMRRMFNQKDTVAMVTGHMNHGLEEWISGYYEVLSDGVKKGIDMPVWESYRVFVDEYINRK